MDAELDLKESAFNKILQLLRDYNHKVEILNINKDSNAEIQFHAAIYLPNETGLFFFVTLVINSPIVFQFLQYLILKNIRNR
jgi:hypothetical protein